MQDTFLLELGDRLDKAIPYHYV